MDINIRFPEIKPLMVKRYAKIISTGVGLPEDRIMNNDIINEFDIIATDRAVEYTLGVKERRWMNVNEKLEDIMEKAVVQCLERANIKIDKVDRIIFTRLFGDFQVPASSISVLKKLNAKIGIPAFDITSACSGFMHAMDLAMRYIATGDDYILVIGGSAFGKCVRHFKNPDSKTVFLFGDAIVAMLLGYSELKHILASYLFTNHWLYDNAYVKCGTNILKEGVSGINSKIFQMQITDGGIVFESSAKYSRIIADQLLKASKLSIEDIDFFITSDQSTKIWEAQLKELNIPREKSISMFRKYGNTVSAMSPLNLNEMIKKGILKRGNIVMMQAHGAGASSGGMIFKY